MAINQTNHGRDSCRTLLTMIANSLVQYFAATEPYSVSPAMRSVYNQTQL
jgi:hypothetical protein